MTMLDYVYIPSAGETWDEIAMTLWGGWKYAADLICANPQYVDRVTMNGTERLKLPDMSAEYAAQSSAPWKEE